MARSEAEVEAMVERFQRELDRMADSRGFRTEFGQGYQQAIAEIGDFLDAYRAETIQEDGLTDDEMRGLLYVIRHFEDRPAEEWDADVASAQEKMLRRLAQEDPS